MVSAKNTSKPKHSVNVKSRKGKKSKVVKPVSSVSVKPSKKETDPAEARFNTAQYKNTGFHFPTARITNALKAAVISALVAPLAEIQKARDSKKKLTSLTPTTKGWIKKSEHIYTEYLRVREVKGAQQHEKAVEKWNNLNKNEDPSVLLPRGDEPEVLEETREYKLVNDKKVYSPDEFVSDESAEVKGAQQHKRAVEKWEAFAEDVLEETREYKLVNDKKVYSPGEFVLDKFADVDVYTRARELISRNKLKYSNTIGVQFAILLDDLVKEWVSVAIDNCNSDRVTIRVQDFIYKLDPEDKTKRVYMEDVYHSGESRTGSLIPLVLGFRNYHNAKSGTYDVVSKAKAKTSTSTTKDKKGKKGKKGKKSTTSKKRSVVRTVRSAKTYTHYIDFICQSVRSDKIEKSPERKIKFSKEVRLFMSDIVTELINKMGSIIKSRMYFFEHKQNKAKTVSVEIMYELINTVLIYHNVDNQIYNESIADRVNKYKKFCDVRREMRTNKGDVRQKKVKEEEKKLKSKKVEPEEEVVDPEDAEVDAEEEVEEVEEDEESEEESEEEEEDESDEDSAYEEDGDPE